MFDFVFLIFYKVYCFGMGLFLCVGFLFCSGVVIEVVVGSEVEIIIFIMFSFIKVDEGVFFKCVIILVVDIDWFLEIYRDILGFEVF